MDMPDTSDTDGPEPQPIKRFKFVEENKLDEIAKGRTEATTNKQTLWGVKLFQGTLNVPIYHDIWLIYHNNFKTEQKVGHWINVYDETQLNKYNGQEKPRNKQERS